MKRLLIIFILTFSFQSWTKADDIREFEIEGMSIGDSALDYFSEKEILDSVKTVPQYNKDDYKIAYIQKSNKYDFEIYDGITFYYKKNNSRYKIVGIVGSKYYLNNFKDCLKDLKIMKKDIEKSFSINPAWEGKQQLPYDKSGKTILHGARYDFASNGDLQMVCYDWSEELSKKEGRIDELTLAISNSEYGKWMIRYN